MSPFFTVILYESFPNNDFVIQKSSERWLQWVWQGLRSAQNFSCHKNSGGLQNASNLDSSLLRRSLYLSIITLKLPCRENCWAKDDFDEGSGLSFLSCINLGSPSSQLNLNIAALGAIKAGKLWGRNIHFSKLYGEDEYLSNIGQVRSK